MKFSILLPTRNRLEYLRQAVDTVRGQDYDDWEIVISDNASEEDVAGYARSLGDPRIRYYRTERFVPVTDNWNNALEKSSGDYVIMLGDDDGLLRHHLRTLERLIREHDQPDLVYTGAYLYAYPGVMPGFPEGFLQLYSYAEFLSGADRPFLLERERAAGLVRSFFRFQVRYGFNMQFSVIRRAFIDSLASRGPFFQSPFPDYYASNVMLLKAGRILACPYPLVVIGITPRSYGYYLFNGLEKAGAELLNGGFDGRAARRLRRVVMPGTNLNTSWLFALEAIRANYGAEFPLRVPYQRYRFLQLLYAYDGYLKGQLSREELAGVRKALRWWERALSGSLWGAAGAVERLTGRRARARLVRGAQRYFRQLPSWTAEPVRGRYRSLREVFEEVEPFAPVPGAAAGEEARVLPAPAAPG